MYSQKIIFTKEKEDKKRAQYTYPTNLPACPEPSATHVLKTNEEGQFSLFLSLPSKKSLIKKLVIKSGTSLTPLHRKESL